MSLSVSNLVNVTVSLTPNGAAALSFGVLLIAGDSNVVNGAERYRTYTDIDSVANDFGLTAPEYLAAVLYFGQSPQPSECLIGRWFSSASAAQNIGGILTASQQALNLWTSISNGGFDITVDGAALTLTALKLHCRDEHERRRFRHPDGASVGGVRERPLLVERDELHHHVFYYRDRDRCDGRRNFYRNDDRKRYPDHQRQDVDFVSGTPAAHQVAIGASAAATAANLQAYLMSAAALADTDLNVCQYSTTLAVTTITYGTVGTAGNSIAVSKSSTEITLSGLSSGDLSGGTVPSSVGYATSPTSSYTDISAQLALTASTNLDLVAGFAAESPVACIQALANLRPPGTGRCSRRPLPSPSISISRFRRSSKRSPSRGPTA